MLERTSSQVDHQEAADRAYTNYLHAKQTIDRSQGILDKGELSGDNLLRVQGQVNRLSHHASGLLSIAAKNCLKIPGLYPVSEIEFIDDGSTRWACYTFKAKINGQERKLVAKFLKPIDPRHSPKVKEKHIEVLEDGTQILLLPDSWV